MTMAASSAVEPLIRRKIFNSEEEAINALLRDYVLRQIDVLKEEIARFEQKYGMRFDQFTEYLHERSTLLQREGLSTEQRRALGQAVMQEEDDWLDWKVAREMLDSWLGLHKEVTV